MNSAGPAYDLWGLVILNSAVFLMFAFSFFKPQTARDWRTFGAFAAFIVALFVEMYGFPLTIYLMSGWLQTRYPGLDILSHDAGHLWSTLLGDKGLGGDPHFGVFHLLSFLSIGGGFWLLSSASTRDGLSGRHPRQTVMSSSPRSHQSPRHGGVSGATAGTHLASAIFPSLPRHPLGCVLWLVERPIELRSHCAGAITRDGKSCSRSVFNGDLT